jgi:nucleoside-diphosphate-sugar epimerase
VLPEFFPQLLASGVRRVVALSSTSVFTKQDSLDVRERRLSQKIADAEHTVRQWAQVHGVECVILRPTLIYGSAADKGIMVIAKFIKRFSFFPLCGKASGLRQPVHSRDVANACVSALHKKGAEGMDFNLSGGETLTYREMVSRVFVACGLRPRLVALPVFVFRLGFFVLRLLPRYRHWSLGMALRMNHDQTCDHSQASSVLGFSPQGFTIENNDLPA